MRLGAFLFYLKAVEYDADNNVTNVSIFPESPSTGAGSRAPGNDVLTLITEFPVARVVDPNDPVVISETPSGDLYRNPLSAPHGFMIPLEELVVFGKQDTTPTPVVFEPTPKTRNEIIFFKNLMPFLGLGHLMEIGGCPHTITGLQLSDDGTRTVVSITPLSHRTLCMGSKMSWRVSDQFIRQVPSPIKVWASRSWLTKEPILYSGAKRMLLERFVRVAVWLPFKNTTLIPRTGISHSSIRFRTISRAINGLHSSGFRFVC